MSEVCDLAYVLWLEQERQEWLAFLPLVKEPATFIEKCREDFDRDLNSDPDSAVRSWLDDLARKRGVA